MLRVSVLWLIVLSLFFSCGSTEVLVDRIAPSQVVDVQSISIFYTGLSEFRIPTDFPDWVPLGAEEAVRTRAWFDSVVQYWHYLSSPRLSRESLQVWVEMGHLVAADLTDDWYEVTYVGHYGRIPTIQVRDRAVPLVLMDLSYADLWLETRFFGPYSVEILGILEEFVDDADLPYVWEVSVVTQSNLGLIQGIQLYFDENYSIVRVETSVLERSN